MLYKIKLVFFIIFYNYRYVFFTSSVFIIRLLILDIESITTNIDFNFTNNADFNIFLDMELEKYAKSKGYNKYLVEKGQKYIYIFNAEDSNDLKIYKKFIEKTKEFN